MYLLKAPRFPYQKRIHHKGHLNLATEVLRGFSPGVFNSAFVTHNKHLEQQKIRTKEQAINISLFKITSESYGCQLRQLIGTILFSIFLDNPWIYVVKWDS